MHTDLKVELLNNDSVGRRHKFRSSLKKEEKVW